VGFVGSVGPVFPPGATPRSSKASLPAPSQPFAGSKASSITVSGKPPVRRRVLSTVELEPDPQAVPGSVPTWPKESTTVSPEKSTIASSPFHEALPVFRSS